MRRFGAPDSRRDENEMTSAESRLERDSFGDIAVPSSAYWGAQTQRSLENFRIGGERMPDALIHALALQKKAAAPGQHGDWAARRRSSARPSSRAADEVVAGKLDARVPAGRLADRLGHADQHERQRGDRQPRQRDLGGARGAKPPVHPNDHVNRGQSSNDSFPTAMHIAAARGDRPPPAPAVQRAARALDAKADGVRAIVKIGRTHLQDATPLTLGQEFSGYARAGRDSASSAHREDACPTSTRWRRAARRSAPGLNTRRVLPSASPRRSPSITGLPFVPAQTSSRRWPAHDALVFALSARSTCSRRR